jgi:hypothetical protein
MRPLHCPIISEVYPNLQGCALVMGSNNGLKIYQTTNNFELFTRVGTYVQRGSKFCFVVLVVLVGVTDIAQNTALLSNFTMLPAYCTIAYTFARQSCPAALPGSLARQPCPAALPGSLARQPCPAALPGSLVLQPCPAALPGSLARQPCPAALTASLPSSFAWQPCPGSLTRQPCSAVRPISTAFDARARSLCSHCTVLQWQVPKLHGALLS